MSVESWEFWAQWGKYWGSKDVPIAPGGPEIPLFERRRWFGGEDLNQWKQSGDHIPFFAYFLPRPRPYEDIADCPISKLIELRMRHGWDFGKLIGSQ